jgi:hypothetical protein
VEEREDIQFCEVVPVVAEKITFLLILNSIADLMKLSIIATLSC